MNFVILILLCHLNFVIAFLIVQDKAFASVENRISITSQKMTVKNQENMIIFEGKVRVTKEDLIINADQLKVFFASSPQDILSKTDEPRDNNNDKKAQAKEVSSMEAIGNVTMRQGERSGKADKAVYYNKDEMIILIGDAEIWEKDYNVTGKRMTIYLKEDRSIVEDSKVIIIDSKSNKPGGRK